LRSPTPKRKRMQPRRVASVRLHMRLTDYAGRRLTELQTECGGATATEIVNALLESTPVEKLAKALSVRRTIRGLRKS
jgi:hypothetical protein